MGGCGGDNERARETGIDAGGAASGNADDANEVASDVSKGAGDEKFTNSSTFSEAALHSAWEESKVATTTSGANETVL